MKVIECTPATTLPAHVIVMQDEAWCERHPDDCFYLRVENAEGVKTFSLPGETTLPGARDAARRMGYEPSHWVDRSFQLNPLTA